MDSSTEQYSGGVRSRQSPTEKVLGALHALGRKVKEKGARRWDCDCPACDDHGYHLGVEEAPNDGRALLHCFHGCSPDAIVAALGLRLADLFAEKRKGNGRNEPLTLRAYLQAKKLDLAIAEAAGLADGFDEYDRPCLLIPYRDENGKQIALHYRYRLEGGEKGRFGWPKGTKAKGLLYGRERLPEARAAKRALLFEGESDPHTCWQHGFPAFGVPGADMVNPKRLANDFADIERLYIGNERDKGAPAFLRSLAAADGLAERVWVLSFGEYKDPSALHLADPEGFVATMEVAMQAAMPLADVLTQLTTASANGKVEQASEEAEGSKDYEASLRQIQVNNRQLRDTIAEAWAAVHAANSPPTLFLRSGALARLVDSGDGPSIEVETEVAMYGLLARVADWTKVTEHGERNAYPTRDVARDMLAYPSNVLPQLETVAFAPVFDQHGKLLTGPGYHESARLWLHQPKGLSIGVVPEHPSPEQVQEAKSWLLDELLVDFPFASPADRAHAAAALLLPFLRPMVGGCTPLHLIEAPVPGAGKGLLADVTMIGATGRCCEPTTITLDEDETRKKITSLLAKAPPIILLDNIRTGIESAQLAAALTAEVWSDRVLGVNRMVALPNRATWLATANNPRLSLEVARRCARIRLDPQTDRPWERSEFRHDPLREWAKANRGHLVHALLVLAQAWISADQPPGAKVLGSFENWARVLGGILANAGIDGFLGNTEELYEAADAEGNEWREFVAAWWDVHRDAWVGAKDLLKLALERDLLGGVLGDKSEKSPRSQQSRLGRALTAVRDRHFGEWRVLVRHDARTKSARYCLGTGKDAGHTRDF